jgi:AI-2 transport protein TqsA
MLTLAGCLVIAATSWYLLKEFAALLRPLFLAVFLCYVILPIHQRLKQAIPGIVSMVVMVGASVGLLFLLTLLFHASVVELYGDLPRLTQRAKTIAHRAETYLDEHLPWLIGYAGDDTNAEEIRTRKLQEIAGTVANAAAEVLLEAFVVGFYLLFLLLEVWRFPNRVRAAFVNEQAQRVLAVVDNINTAMANYLRVKVKASLCLAVPVTVVLWACGVRFALMWGVLTFLCNFIPYIGSIIAWSLPILFAFLQLDFGWQPVAAAAGVIAIHLVMTYLVEPSMVGKGVGLSPLVILVALAFWGQCWGVVGMFLAIPLTVMLKIVLDNVAFTRPLARLLADE